MNKNTFTLQEILACYRAWNEAERHEQIRNAGKKPLEQKWQEYLELMAFGLALKPTPSQHEQRQKVESLNRYYEQIQRFEVRRASHRK
ncbi:hypothetical protein U27_01197 [Candidatus Vecturithrix granuli]|uniref:Uncharacterized protein n=1 Tax=Vecturithrix granuli TaxID=1499967 RepID=A0A081C9P2_VECG1|nr:hypothetical protein U27_01197 [Candidatus Vecturithrix granuli]